MIDLQRPRDVGELVSTMFVVFGRRWLVFLPLTFVVVAPVIVLVDGVWGGVLANGPRVHQPVAAALVSVFLKSTVVPAVVTGLHCVVVAALGEGRRVGIGEAISDLVPRLPRAFGAVLLYIGGVGIGLIALVIPGIWVAIRWYFSVQAAVLERCRPAAAINRSGDLVDGSWWRVLGLWLAMSLITGLLVAPASGASFGDSGMLWVAANVLAQTLALSLTAIYGTLMFFDLRARQGAADAGPGEPWAAREFTRTQWLPPQPPPVA